MINRFWFEPSRPQNLAVSRVVFYFGLWAFYFPVDFAAWGAVSDAFWTPLPLFNALHLTAAPVAVLRVLELVWRMSLLTSAVGFHTRLSTSVAALIGVYLLGLPHNFGHTYHFDALLAIGLVVLACSRAGDACSIDALVTRRAVERSAEYTWPIKFMRVMMALLFFAAGVAKVRHGGLAWVTSSSMSLILMRSAYHTSDADPIGTLGLWVASHPLLSRASAGAAVFIELGFVTALFSRTARIIFVPAACALLVGIRVMMGPTFGGLLIMNAFWVPWEMLHLPRLARVLALRRGMHDREPLWHPEAGLDCRMQRADVQEVASLRVPRLHPVDGPTAKMIPPGRTI
jgi:hypothetical protein